MSVFAVENFCEIDFVFCRDFERIVYIDDGRFRCDDSENLMLKLPVAEPSDTDIEETNREN